jgi:hypothetical protein
VDSSGAAASGLSYSADAASISNTQDAHATLVCLREDDSPADVDPRDVEFEGRITEWTEGGDGPTSGEGVSGVALVSAVDGSGAAVVGTGRTAATATASGMGAASDPTANLVVTVTRTAPGKFSVRYLLSVTGSDDKARQVIMSARVLGKLVNSPLHIAVRRILMDKQVRPQSTAAAIPPPPPRFSPCSV